MQYMLTMRVPRLSAQHDRMSGYGGARQQHHFQLEQDGYSKQRQGLEDAQPGQDRLGREGRNLYH